MKKIGVLLGLFLLTVVLVSATTHGETSQIQEDYEETKELIDSTVPVGSDGKLDKEAFKPFTSKSEQRIMAINVWLDSNISWMRFLFHMKPALSWTFLWNLFFIFFFLTTFVVNGADLFFFFERARNARLFGLGVFIVLLAFGLYEALAKWVYSLFAYLWHVLLPVSLILALLGGLFLLVAFFVARPLVKNLILHFHQYRKARRLAKLQAQASSNAQSFNTFLKEVGNT